MGLITGLLAAASAIGAVGGVVSASKQRKSQEQQMRKQAKEAKERALKLDPLTTPGASIVLGTDPTLESVNNVPEKTGQSDTARTTTVGSQFSTGSVLGGLLRPNKSKR